MEDQTNPIIINRSDERLFNLIHAISKGRAVHGICYCCFRSGTKKSIDDLCLALSRTLDFEVYSSEYEYEYWITDAKIKIFIKDIKEVVKKLEKEAINHSSTLYDWDVEITDTISV